MQSCMNVPTVLLLVSHVPVGSGKVRSGLATNCTHYVRTGIRAKSLSVDQRAQNNSR